MRRVSAVGCAGYFTDAQRSCGFHSTSLCWHTSPVLRRGLFLWRLYLFDRMDTTAAQASQVLSRLRLYCAVSCLAVTTCNYAPRVCGEECDGPYCLLQLLCQRFSYSRC